MQDAPRYATLQDYLRVVREQRLLIIATMILAAGVALGLAIRKDQVFEAISRVDVQQINDDAARGGRPLASQAALFSAAVRTPEVRRRALLLLPPAARQFGATSRLETTTATIALVARADKGATAAAVANAYASALIAEITQVTRKRLRDSERALRRQIKQIPPARRDSFTYATLQQRQLQLAAAARVAEPLVLSSQATVPGAPISPKPVRDTILGAIAGLVLGLLFAFLRDVVDVRMRRPEDVARQFGHPIVGFVREDALGSTGMAPNEELADTEAFAILRANIEAMGAGGKPPKVLLVTSAIAAEGKSTVAMRLASASALAGRRTLLVECDLRRPVLRDRLSLPEHPGLSDYLTGHAGPRDVLQAIELVRGRGEDPSALLAIITAGSHTTRVAELLSSPRFEQFITGVREAYDVIILDTGPVLAVADPIEIAPRADAILFCLRLGATRKGEAMAARTAISRVDRPLALVLTGMRPDRDSEYLPYAYSYAYSQAPASSQIG